MLKKMMAGLALSVFASAVSANGIKYDYGEFRYFTGEIDDADLDGIEIGGSLKLNEEVFILGSFSDGSFDNSDADTTALQLGVGYVLPLSEQVDLASSVSIIHAEFDSPGGSDDDTGFELAAEVRTMLAAIPQLELRGTLAYVDVGDSDLQLRAAGDYHVNNQFSVGLELNLAGDIDGISLGARYYFR